MMADKPLRVAYLVSKYPAVSHTFILREVLALRERGIAVDVASINSPPPQDEMTQPEQSEAGRTFYVKRAGASGALAALGYFIARRPAGLLRGLGAALRLSGATPQRIPLYIFYYLEAAILARWMAARSLEHLHVHFATPAATVAMILTSIAPVTMSMTVHGPDEFYDVPGYHLERKVEACSFVVCISFFARSQLMKVTSGECWSKFEIGRLGVDCGHFLPRPFPQSSPARAFQILCVGRLVSTKGQRVLIAAVTRLVQAGRRIDLHLVGDGPDRGSLERLVRESGMEQRVFFAGSVNQDNIQAFYAAADIFALASFAEGIPVVLMEAMAMEIPCVATAINGIPELVRDQVDGLLVAPSDVDGMAAAIARLMDDEALRESLGKAGRARVERDYELSGSAERLAAIFRNRLGEAR